MVHQLAQLLTFAHIELLALRLALGQTPTQLMDKSRSGQLSLLYKTDTFR